MGLTENRVDASLLSEEERRLLQQLLDLTQRDQHPCLKGSDGTEIRLPEPVYQMLVSVLQDMRDGRAVVLMPEDETFTTQAAANYLGMSRQYFVKLLESGKIPFHKVGSHRRVSLKDLRAYEKVRDTERRGRLNRLFKEVNQAGHYDASFTGEE